MIFKNREINEKHKYGGSISDYVTWKASLLLHGGTLKHGTSMMLSTFKPEVIPDELKERIQALEKSTNIFVPLGAGTPEQIAAHDKQHDRNVAELQLKYKNLENLTKTIDEMTMTATKIIVKAMDITDGTAKTSVETIVNNPAMDIQQKPTSIIQICRNKHYPPGSATTACDLIKLDTDRLPSASTVAEIQENVEAITRACSQIKSIGEELDNHYRPQFDKMNAEIARKEAAINALRQPPPDFPLGQVFQVNDLQIAMLQREIQQSQYDRNELLNQSRRDQVAPLNLRILAIHLINSLPSHSNDHKMTSIRNVVEKIAQDDHIDHPWSVYEVEISKLLRQQDVMQALANPPQPQYEKGYIVQDASITEESALAARYTLPCYNYLISSCSDRKCSFSHAGQQGSRNEFQGLLTRCNRLQDQNKNYKAQVEDLLQTMQHRGDGINNSHARSQSPHSRGRSQSPGRNEPYSKQGGKGLAPRSRTPSPSRDQDGGDQFRKRGNNYRAGSPYHG